MTNWIGEKIRLKIKKKIKKEKNKINNNERFFF